jgi:hypothetical protein
VTDESPAAERPEPKEARETPSADDRPGAQEADRQSVDDVRGKASSDEHQDDVGGEDDGDSTGEVGQIQRSKASGDRAIERALRSAVAQGDGPAFYVERQDIHYSGRRVFVQRSIAPVEDVDREAETYEPVNGFEDMLADLKKSGLLPTRGGPGSGRETTGRMLLHKAGCRRVGTLSVNDDDVFAVMHEQLERPARGKKPLMERDDGYVIHLSGDAVTKGSVTAFREAVRAAGVRVVVVLNSEDRVDDVESSFDLERPHCWPDRDEVVKRHVGFLLREHRSCCNQEFLRRYQMEVVAHDIVQSRIKLAPSVLRLVRLARFLAGKVHEARDRDLKTLVPQWDDSAVAQEWADSATVLARTILKGNAPPDKPHLVPQQQAFRIAYAVFHGQELAYVFLTAKLLLEKLISVEGRRKQPKSRIFDRSVEALIHPRMVAITAGVEEEGPRCARLADESLIVAILEVAWHDYDQLREPLTLWLDELAGEPDLKVQIRGAQIVGLLAVFDYQGVFDRMIKRWAKGKAALRTSAAFAMDQIHQRPDHSVEVRRQVEKWSRSKLVAEQDTAAKWYGLRDTYDEVSQAFEQLGDIGRRPQLSRSSSIAVAMSLLFLNGHDDEVVEELGRWTRSDHDNPYLPHHAVRTLLILSTQNDASDQPSARLSELAVKNDERRAALVRMWRQALASRTIGVLAWERMRDWVIEADAHEDESELVASLAEQIFTEALAPRARFNLKHWQKIRPDVRLIDRIHERLSPAGKR